MSDPNPGSQSSRWTLFEPIPFSEILRLLVARRDGLRALIWAATINLVLFGFFLTSATFVYDTNDDLTMQLIASGFYTGHPDAHLVFTNILIGWILQFLYVTWIGNNWYLIYLLAVHYAALTAIAFLVVSRRGGWLFTFLYVGFFLMVETHILLRLQFTTTAFLTGTAGLLLLVDGLQPNRPVQWPRAIAGLGYWGLMCLIREPVAIFLAAAACPFLLERFGKVGWGRVLGVGLTCLGTSLVLHEINLWVYQSDSAWAKYLAYNRLRGEIQGTVLAEYLPQVDRAVGWSLDDGWMFSEFYFSEPDVYGGVPRMRLLLNKLKVFAHNEPHAEWYGLPADFLFLPHVFTHTAAILMVLAILNGMWCVSVAGAFRFRCLITLLASYALFVVLAFHLVTTARLPERVSYNFPLFILAACLYWASGFRIQPIPAGTCSALNTLPARMRQFILSRLTMLARVLTWAFPLQKKRRCGRLLLSALALIWAATYLFYLSTLAHKLWLENASNNNLKETSHKIMEPTRQLVSGKNQPLFIMMPADSVLERCLVFYPSAERIPFSMVPSGWLSQSPIYSQILDQHHLHPYSLSLVDRSDVFFLMQRRWRNPLKLFYRQHYGLNVRFDMVLDTDVMPGFEDCQLHLYQAHVIAGKARSQTARTIPSHHS